MIRYYEFIDCEKQLSLKDFRFIEKFIKRTNRNQIGWHYIIDLTWIYSKVRGWPRNINVLDAGGGGGPLQFLMAELGFNVTNIDMMLGEPSVIYRNRYKINLRELQSCKHTEYADYFIEKRFIEKNTIKNVNILKVLTRTFKVNYIWQRLKQLAGEKLYNDTHERWRKQSRSVGNRIGSINWIKGNLCALPEVEENFFDAVVSLSALEHIPINQLEDALSEIQRIAKPDARWAITTSGTHCDTTWFHEPSHGNCFSKEDIEYYFDAASLIDQDTTKILDHYKSCLYLRDNLAKFYFKSKNNGMPWGVWDPQYIPVGIFTCRRNE